MSVMHVVAEIPQEYDPKYVTRTAIPLRSLNTLDHRAFSFLLSCINPARSVVYGRGVLAQHRGRVVTYAATTPPPILLSA